MAAGYRCGCVLELLGEMRSPIAPIQSTGGLQGRKTILDLWLVTRVPHIGNSVLALVCLSV